MRDQTRDLRALLGLDARVCVHKQPCRCRRTFQTNRERMYADYKPFFEWWRQRTPEGLIINDETESIKAIMAPKASHETNLATEYIGLERSIAHVYEQICQLWSFNVFVGFSQGSATITLLQCGT